MAHKHGHHHGHHHHHVGQSEHAAPDPQNLSTAEKSLSEALGLSFAILKVIMIVLVVAFVASGFKTVGSNEQALRLVFGRIQGTGEARVLGSGWHWVFPYPIGEIVRIPVKKQIKLTVGNFWYWETRNDVVGEGPKPRRRFGPKLNPLREGYCLTRSQLREDPGAVARASLGNADGSDYNIVHCKWEIDYQIDNIEQFFSNVLISEVRPGQIYEEVMVESMTPLLRSVIESSVVTAMVQYSIDEALQSRDRIPRHVRQLLQKQLDDIESGIRVTSVQLVDVEWPKQVNDAFEAYFTASQTSQQTISEARTYAEQTLTDAGGQLAEPLYQALMSDTPDEEKLEGLWSQVAGQAQNTIAQARAYRTKVVEAAKANATYLLSILPEFRKRPELVKQRLYLDAVEEVLDNAEEKFIVQPSTRLKGQEIRVLVNRDPLATKQAEAPSN
jgi:modulator of FtsH protease HflK